MTFKAARYYPLLDAFRFLAAVAIVWLHIAGVPALQRSKDLGRFAVPFFTSTATFLAYDALRRRGDTSLGEYSANRFRRIYLLFLAWSVFYWFVRSASSILFKHEGWVRLTPRGLLLDGEAIQLWFLPFIVVATSAAFAVAKGARSWPTIRLPAAVLLAVGGILIGMLPTPGWVQAAGYAPWLSYDAFPGCLWGIAFGLFTDQASAPPPRQPQTIDGIAAIQQPPFLTVMTVVGATGIGAWLFFGLPFGRSLLLENAAGFGLFLLALSRVTVKPAPLLAALGSISFGIYLAHALFVDGMQHLLPRLGMEPSGSRDAMVWLLSVLGSCAFVLALKRSGSWGAWLAG